MLNSLLKIFKKTKEQVSPTVYPTYDLNVLSHKLYDGAVKSENITLTPDECSELFGYIDYATWALDSKMKGI